MLRTMSLAAKALAATACVSLIASPVMAAALPQAATQSALSPAAKTWSPADDIASDRGRGGWGRGGWGGRHHHDDGIDGGDVFAGLLILGGIAAIASAASSNKRKSDDDYRYRDRRVDDERAPGGWQQPLSRGDASRAMDQAVDACAAAADERGEIGEIYGVQRDGAGYRVTGRMSGGGEFACSTGADGRVRELTGADRAAKDDAYQPLPSPDFADATGG